MNGILNYVASGEYAWLVQIVFLITVGLSTGVIVGNKQSYKLRQLNLSAEQIENAEKRRMEQLVIEGSKISPSNDVAVIEHGNDKPKRRRK